MVPPNHTIGYLEEAVDHYVREGSADKYVKDEVVDGHFNDVGKMRSHVEEVRQAVGNYLTSSDFENADAFMRGKGYEPVTEINFFGYGFMEDEAVAGVNSETGLFVFNKDFAAKIAAEMEKYHKQGVYITFEEMIEATVEHELVVHLYGVKSEKKLEALLIEFYEKHGDRDNPKYERKRKVSEDRLSRVDELYSPSERMSLESVVEEYRAAAEELGLEGKDADNYIAKKVGEYKGKRGKSKMKSSYKTNSDGGKDNDGAETTADSADAGEDGAGEEEDSEGGEGGDDGEE
jgi:hypothetical protein